MNTEFLANYNSNTMSLIYLFTTTFSQVIYTGPVQRQSKNFTERLQSSRQTPDNIFIELNSIHRLEEKQTGVTF